MNLATVVGLIKGSTNSLKSAIGDLDTTLNGGPGPMSINLFNPDDPDVMTGKYLDADGNEVTLSGFGETGFIPCVNEDTLTFYKNGAYLTGSRVMCFYDEQKNFVSGGGKTMPTAEVTSVGVAYARFAFTTAEADILMIVKNDTEIHEYVPYGPTRTEGLCADVEALSDEVEEVKKPWDGKKVVLLGDSIVTCNGNTSMKGYSYYLEQLGFSTITNKAHGGACAAYHSETHYEDVVTTVDDVNFSSYDLAIIAAGVNDYYVSSASPIGTLVNSVTATDFTKTDFIGALQYIITKALTSKPGIKIALFTPLKINNFNTANSQSKVLKDYADAIKTVADYYSIPVLDFYSMSGLNRMNFSTYLSDGVHPTEAGYKFICENKLKSFIANL